MSRWTALYQKDLRGELRQPQFVLGVVFFQFCLLFLFFLFQDGNLPNSWWANLFWVNALIAAMSLVLKNFAGESANQYAYYYQLTDPVTLYVSKVLYNFSLLAFATAVNLILFTLLFDTAIPWNWRFLLMLVVGVLAMSLSLTFVAFIAGFGRHASLLVNILVIPVIIPLFLVLIRSTAASLGGFYLNWSGDMSIAIGIAVLMAAMGLGLFPYLWKR